MKKGLHIKIGENRQLDIAHLLLDFTGTLSLDGKLLRGVADRLSRLNELFTITVLTADTFGTARKELEGLAVEVRVIRTGQDKVEVVTELGAESVCAIGNGNNDVGMVRNARLGIAIIGPEGCSSALLSVSQVAARDILDAFDLLLNPLRLKATLRD